MAVNKEQNTFFLGWIKLDIDIYTMYMINTQLHVQSTI